MESSFLQSPITQLHFFSAGSWGGACPSWRYARAKVQLPAWNTPTETNERRHLSQSESLRQPLTNVWLLNVITSAQPSLCAVSVWMGCVCRGEHAAGIRSATALTVSSLCARTVPEPAWLPKACWSFAFLLFILLPFRFFTLQLTRTALRERGSKTDRQTAGRMEGCSVNSDWIMLM